MDISKREMIEWLNYWIEDANEYKKRMILIGDSVTRDIRKKISFYAGRGVLRRSVGNVLQYFR